MTLGARRRCEGGASKKPWSDQPTGALPDASDGFGSATGAAPRSGRVYARRAGVEHEDPRIEIAQERSVTTSEQLGFLFAHGMAPFAQGLDEIAAAHAQLLR